MVINLINQMKLQNILMTFLLTSGKNWQMKSLHLELCKSFLNDKVKNMIFLEPPRVSEILDIINSLKSKKSCDDNVILSYFIKVASDILALYLSYFFFLSFNFGIFPDFLKIASVIPIHKTDSKCNMANYHPISILPCLSKFQKN